MPGPIVANVPETEAIMPRRILTSRAYQLVPEPVSQAMMHFSGSLGDNSQKTRCGLSGSASFIARFWEDLPPALDVVLDGLAPRSIGFAIEQRQ